MSDLSNYELFTRLLVQHEPEIIRAVMVIVPERADARDILQETAVALWRHFDRYDPNRPFVNWALGYARVEMRRFMRSRARRAVLMQNAVELIEQAQDDRAAITAMRAVALRGCLDRLPEHAGAVLRGYYFDDRTVESIALSQGRSVEAIYKILQRLRAALLDCISSRLSPT